MLKRIKTLLFDALFPKNVSCFACNRETVPDESGLCTDCAESVLRYLPDNDFCPEKLDGFAAGIMYEGIVPKAVKRFKYYGATYLGEFLAQYMPMPPEWQPDVLVPVPLHKKRLKSRGYNQSMLLAVPLSERTGVPVQNELLIRTRNTKKQARTTHKKSAENMKDAFFAPMDCTGMRIVIIDDVCTTGSTMNECAKALRAAGAEAVFGISACRASKSN